jgi:hypothetical protein
MIGAVSRTRAVVTALLVIPVLLVAGCTDDDPKPKFEPTQSSETPTSPSTSASAQALGPEATVGAWVDARNTALVSGDVAPVEALSTTDCTTCQDSLDPIRQVHAAGGSFDTGGWKVVSARLKSQSAGKARVTAAINYQPGTTISSEGAAPVSYGLERHIVVVDLVGGPDRWQVRFIGYLS